MARPAPTQAPRSDAQPLTADLRRLHVTVSKRFTEKLEAARDALSHSHPGATPASTPPSLLLLSRRRPLLR